MKKIAVICPYLNHINRGTENATMDTNRFLEKRGYKVDTFCLSNTVGLKKKSGIGKVSDKLFDITMLGGFLRKYIGYSLNIEDIAFSLSVQKSLGQVASEYDLLWSSGEIWNDIAIDKMRSKYKVPTLNFFGGGISEMMVKQAKLLSDIFAVMTPMIEKWLRERVPDANIKTVVGGIDLDFFHPNVNWFPLLSETSKHPIVMSSSAFIESKRLDLLVKAVAEVQGTLVMTSSGPLREKICKLGEQLLGTDFIYLGVQPFDIMPSIYKSCDLFVLPSRNEPYGRTLLEAMGCNIPVIAEKDETREWMVGNGGLLIDDMRDNHSLAEAIAKSKDINWGNRPRNQAEKFGWDRTIDDYEDAFRRFLGW
jgi:glycosyltransferase involved in cell wall biosynthesis